MNKKATITLHIFIWLFAAFIQLNKQMFESTDRFIGSTFAFLYIMLFFYLFYSVLVPLYLAKKRIWLFLIVALASIIIVPFFGYHILFLIRALFNGSFEGFYQGYSIRMHFSSFIPFTLSATFGSFFKVIINWYEVLEQKSNLEKQKVITELNLLKMNLNPHFLFNTLNNIDSLIYQNPKEASNALVKLSVIMRYMTYEISSDYIELSKEVDYIQHIIDLHRLRIKNPDLIQCSFEGNFIGFISPALFFPFIENAFKHASLYDDKPGISISLKESEGKVFFRVSNYFDRESSAATDLYHGNGLENLKRRLELIYPEKHQLKITSENHNFVVELSIKINENQVYSS